MIKIIMGKLITFITTETDGLHEDYPNDKTLKKNLYKYAHMVKLVYHQGYYENGKINTTVKKSYLVKPEHFFFPDELKKINGLTHKKLVKKGDDLEKIMTEFVNDLKKSYIIIGHNLRFHIKTIQASSFRSGVELDLRDVLMVDIMNYNHDVEKPNLNNLTKHFLGEKYLEKPRSYQINLIKKIFGKLYENMEKSVKN